MRNFLLFCLLLSGLQASGTLATPVTITSITVSNGIATLNMPSAHNIPANNPGGCILGSSQSNDNICFAASTVPTSTSLTIASASMTACSSSCGTVQPAQLFLVKNGQPGLGTQSAFYCMWTFTPNGAAITGSGAITGCASQIGNATLLNEVNAAIAAGNWIEQDFQPALPSTYTPSSIENYVLAQQFSAQLALAAASAPGSIAGKTCDVTGCN